MGNPPRNGEQNEFILITKAKDLVKHTFLMTNDRRFPKKYRFTVVNRLQDLVIDIFQHIQEANELDLSDPQEFRERRYEQKTLSLNAFVITMRSFGSYTLKTKYSDMVYVLVFSNSDNRESASSKFASNFATLGFPRFPLRAFRNAAYRFPKSYTL